MSPPAGAEARTLLVVESPTRALALRKVVGPGVRVLATAGAVFARRGSVRRGGGRVLQELRSAGREADRILVATDPDREGEAIAADLLRFLAALFPGRVARVFLAGDSAADVARALSAPARIDRGRLAARVLREELDRRFLAAAGRILGEAGTCGRVQAVALGRVAERSREESPAFVVELRLELAEGKVAATVEPPFASRDEAERWSATVAGRALPPAAIRRRRVEEPPPAAFDTAALLAEADRLGLGPERVLEAARRLHRGVELADGVEPLLSYPRTAEATIEPEDGDRPLAHGAIRPVAAAWPPERAAPFLGAAERKVYERVWWRTAAARAEPSVLEAIEAELGEGRVARAVRVIAPGWHAVGDGGAGEWWAAGAGGRREAGAGGGIAGGAGGGIADGARSGIPGGGAGAPHGQGQPGARVGRARVIERPGAGPYRPGELIAELAALGVGRPSTWATIARGLREAGWVCGEGGRLRVTEEGLRVHEALRRAFGSWLEPENARALEAGLRAVEAGRLEAAEFRSRFVRPLADIAGPRRPACPACGRPLLAAGTCSGFPLCRGSA